MRKRKLRLVACGVMLLVVGLFSTAHADTMLLDLTMWIDHSDTLTVDGTAGTAQWHYNGANVPVGLWDGRSLETQLPTSIAVTNNGSLLNTYEWKQWTTMPSYWTPADSSILKIGELSLLAGATINSIGTSKIQGRNSMNFDVNGLLLKIDCYDWYGGAAWYEAQVSIDYTPASAVPLPAAVFLLGPGLAGLVAVRGRFQK